MRMRVAILTIVESAALAVWLALIFAGKPLQAFLILFAGLTLEHVLRLTLFGIPVGARLRDTVIFSFIETILWAAWEAFLLPRFGPIVGNILLATGLVVEHTLTANVVSGKPLFGIAFDPAKINASIVEAVGAGLWRGAVATAAGIPEQYASIGVFAVFNYFEHAALVEQEESAR